MVPSDIKTKLFNHCTEYVNFHIETNRRAIEQAQDAAASETQTVASEEPETGKERSQREMESLGRRLEEVFKQQTLLQAINYKKSFSCVEPGALVETSIGNFFISLSADEIEIDGVEYCPVSLESPIGEAIKNARAGESVSFRGKKVRIEHIC
jgi:anion-transporting  ArsA/GET3 family ATPase